MIKWKTQVEFRYEDEEDSFRPSQKIVLGIFENEQDAYNIANEFYNKTKDLYQYPLDCAFGKPYAFSKKDISILKIKKDLLKKSIRFCSVHLTTRRLYEGTIEDCNSFLQETILK